VTVVELYTGAVVVDWQVSDRGDDPAAAALARRIGNDGESLTLDDLEPLVALGHDLGTAYRSTSSDYGHPEGGAR
jgi:hypothetical protein